MNISQLREVITELLSASPNLVGEYILPTGQSIPAVYVSGRQGVPKEWKVKGLEVTIGEFASTSPRAMIGVVGNRKQWTIVLVDYASNSTSLPDAALRIASRFPDAVFSFSPESDVAYGQYRITIPDMEIMRLRAPA